MTIDIVLGAAFGDEGKGRVTSWLCDVDPLTRKLVVRFNGGHQAGHHVIVKNEKHIFSSFGSGTLQGVNTLVSRFCTVYPIAIVNEFIELEPKLHRLMSPPVFDGLKLYLDSRCPVVTPFDIEWNRRTESINRHGSVGVGFGATLARHEAHYKVLAIDLYNDFTLQTKLELVISYYKSKGLTCEWDSLKREFLESVKTLRSITQVELAPSYHTLLSRYNHLIFEGAQGILLDQDYGFFPHVTRSHCTSKNVWTLLDEWDVKNDKTSTWYVSRVYQTRHGHGPMSKEFQKIEVDNSSETNSDLSYQGKFRIGRLDTDLLLYAIKCDEAESPNLGGSKSLVLTCLDQVSQTYLDEIRQELNFSNIWESCSNQGSITRRKEKHA